MPFGEGQAFLYLPVFLRIKVRQMLISSLSLLSPVLSSYSRTQLNADQQPPKKEKTAWFNRRCLNLEKPKGARL